ncbi:MAG: 3-isopropylmalate dehydratase large subunit [Neisseriaceae bacterium]
MEAKTLYDKLWDAHVVRQAQDGTALLYIDRHFVHEVTSAQAFEGLSLAGRQPWRTSSIVATADHNVATHPDSTGIVDPIAQLQIETLDRNIKLFNIQNYFPYQLDKRQGIVHVIGPEQGATLPGMTIVCGDSHTSTHGAFAALAYGIGTSEVEHVLATQCLVAKKSANLKVEIKGKLSSGIVAKDLALYLLGKLGTAAGTGYTIEFCGSAVEQLSMEGRMTLCNLAIEAGARSGLVGVDASTIQYLEGRPFAPKGKQWEQAVKYWMNLVSDSNAFFDQIRLFDAAEVKPQITWGTTPEMVISIDERVPHPEKLLDPIKRKNYQRALDYMGLEPGLAMTELPVDVVFIGSCTNGRVEDLRQAARVVKGRKKAVNVKRALVVPGSGLVKAQAEEEGLAKIFTSAGFEWREPGCSMCLAMNEDKLFLNERCASTSNRNFEGRQGAGGRTHLMSPAMAAAAAIAGHFVDHRELDLG